VTGLELSAYAALGAAAGTTAGLLGVGGGIIVVPGLAFLLGDAVPAHRLMQVAVGTSLTTIVATSLSSIRAHSRHGAIRWEVVGRLTPGIIVGAILGAAIADVLPTRGLAAVFGAFLVLAAVRLAVPGQPSAHRELPRTPGLFAWGGGIGTFSSLVGIGGGTITVPFLTWCNVAIRNAVGTSSACGLPIAVTGATGFVVAGWGTPGLPPWSTGYVYWPAFVALVPMSILFAPLGARLAHTISMFALRCIFAVFLLVVGLRMLIG